MEACPAPGFWPRRARCFSDAADDPGGRTFIGLQPNPGTGSKSGNGRYSRGRNSGGEQPEDSKLSLAAHVKIRSGQGIWTISLAPCIISLSRSWVAGE